MEPCFCLASGPFAAVPVQFAGFTHNTHLYSWLNIYSGKVARSRVHSDIPTGFWTYNVWKTFFLHMDCAPDIWCGYIQVALYSVNLLIDSTQPYMWKIRGWTNNPCCEISFQFVLLTIFHSCALSNLYYDRFERNKRINVISTASFQSSLWPTGKACHYQFKI